MQCYLTQTRIKILKTAERNNLTRETATDSSCAHPRTKSQPLTSSSKILKLEDVQAPPVPVPVPVAQHEQGYKRITFRLRRGKQTSKVSNARTTSTRIPSRFMPPFPPLSSDTLLQQNFTMLEEERSLKTLFVNQLTVELHKRISLKSHVLSPLSK